MGAIGSYVVITREDLARCAVRASDVRAETTGWGPFKKHVMHGRDAFETAWRSSVIASVDFTFSGYALAHYLTALESVAGYTLPEFERSSSLALSKVFKSVVPLSDRVALPALPEIALSQHCQSEFGADAATALTALQAADRFYRSALERVDERHIAVILIQ